MRYCWTISWLRNCQFCGSGFIDQKLQCTGLIPRPQSPEAFSPQNRTSRNSKLEISEQFSIFWVIFVLLDPNPDPLAWLNPDPIRIRITGVWSICLFLKMVRFLIVITRRTKTDGSERSRNLKCSYIIQDYRYRYQIRLDLYGIKNN